MSALIGLKRPINAHGKPASLPIKFGERKVELTPNNTCQERETPIASQARKTVSSDYLTTCKEQTKTIWSTNLELGAYQFHPKAGL